MKYAKSPHFPPSEGVVATVTVYYRGSPLDPIVRVLQKTVFSNKEIEKSISYERDKKADEEAERKKAEEEGR